MDRDPVIESLVAGFVAEARDICQRITTHVLALEHADKLDETTRRTHYEDLARGLHTLKGNSDTFGFPRLAELAHKLEDVVQVYRPALVELPSATIDLLLRAIDVFVARLAASGKDDADLPPLEDLTAALVRAAQDARAAKPAAVAVTTAPQPRMTLPPPMGASDDDATPAMASEWRVGPRHVEALVREVERLRELRLRLDEQKREVDRGLRSLARGSASELTEVRDVMTAMSRALDNDSEEAGDIIEALEQELKTVATLPLRWVLDPLQRAVRDLCRSLGKEAQLACVGAEISIDRRVLDALKGPLVHLVRNAVDHGIEAPAVRIAAGKHREGAITVRVELTGNVVLIQIEDDGAGIDVARIRDVAIARGIVTAEEADAMTDRAFHQLVFRPGFSTRAEITELSGRGVGLDAVRGAVQGLSGHIEIQTARGSGTRFVITIPATLGSTPVLVVRADEQLLGIPMIAIETIRAARSDDVRAGRTTSRFEHNGQLLQLVDLAAVLGLRAPAPADAGQPILVLQSRGHRVALVVDELVGDRELVVRPLPPELQDLVAYQGAATQARGDLLLVLQPDFLVEGRAVAATALGTVRHALVVDDSLTARSLHRTILESGGYQVHTVGNARQALEHLRHAHYDIMIADVVMTDVDGVQLTQMLRARRETRGLPIILVSSNDGQPERDRGMAAGADAFLAKKDCVPRRLLSEVAAAIARKERLV